jgi:hypothetical protein
MLVRPRRRCADVSRSVPGCVGRRRARAGRRADRELHVPREAARVAPDAALGGHAGRAGRGAVARIVEAGVRATCGIRALLAGIRPIGDRIGVQALCRHPLGVSGRVARHSKRRAIDIRLPDAVRVIGHARPRRAAWRTGADAEVRLAPVVRCRRHGKRAVAPVGLARRLAEARCARLRGGVRRAALTTAAAVCRRRVVGVAPRRRVA